MSCNASLDADATLSDTSQKTPLTPTLAPKAPNIIGITTLDAFCLLYTSDAADE